MNPSQMLGIVGRRLRLVLMVLAALISESAICAQQIPAHYLEGPIRTFLSVVDPNGKILAIGDLTQSVRGDRVNIHLVFHYRDGSEEEERTVYSQRGSLRLISDDHVQKGPFFPKPINVSIDVPRQQVTVRSTGKDGKVQADTQHMDLPPDLSNGMLGSVVKNVPTGTATTKVSMLVMAPKPRLIKLAISPGDEEAFSVVDTQRKARVYTAKIELGGVAGMAAPIVGKAPPDIHVWVVPGEVPLVIREDAPIFDGSPVLSFVEASPVWSHSAK